MKVNLTFECTFPIIIFLVISMINQVNGERSNDPPIADAGGPYTGYEGEEITLDASNSIDPNNDPLKYMWDLNGDGYYDTMLLDSPVYKYTWSNEYQGFVEVLVTDGILNATDKANVSIENLPPIVEGSDDFTINEGDEFEFSANINDPGIDDELGISIYFDYETDLLKVGGKIPCKKIKPYIEVYDVVYGSVTLKCKLHSNDYQIHDLHFYAHYGSIIQVIFPNANWIQQTTTNWAGIVNPNILENTITLFEIKMEEEMVTIDNENINAYMVQWHITDNDTKVVGCGLYYNNSTLVIPPKEGFPDNCNLSWHPITIEVIDDFGSLGRDVIKVIVNNVPPTVQVGEDISSKIGSTIAFSGNFTDPGWLDTHTIVWDFGDGKKLVGDLNTTHIYSKPGKYNVTLTITDDDGGVDVDSLIVNIKDDNTPNILLIISILFVIMLIIICGFIILRRKK